MNVLSRDHQIKILACLTEGMSMRATTRLCGVDRKTVARLQMQIGIGCAKLHDRTMVGIRTGRIELDEVWGYVGMKQKRMYERGDHPELGDQYTFVALASSSRAIISFRTGKRDGANTEHFIADLRERVIGAPEISADGFQPYQTAVRHAFANSAFGTVVKTYSVTNLNKSAAHRYSPASVVAVNLEAVAGDPLDISTSYIERSHLTLRMSCRRFGRLTNAFSKRFGPHLAAVALHVAYYNFVRSHETLRTSPAVALGVADRVWTLGDLLDAALTTEDREKPAPTPGRFRVIDGGKVD